MSEIESTVDWLESIRGLVEAAGDIAKGGMDEHDSLQNLKARHWAIDGVLDKALIEIDGLKADLLPPPKEIQDICDDFEELITEGGVA